MRFLLLMLTSVAVVPAVGHAQSQEPLQPGTRVRVWFDCGGLNRPPRLDCRREPGIVVRSGPEGIVWEPAAAASAAGPLTRPWSAVRTVEVSRGMRSHAVTGLLIGALAGAVSGALLGAWYYGGLCDCSNHARGAVVGALFFTIPAAPLGATIGSLVTTDRWEEVSPDRLQVVVEPRGQRLGVKLALSF